MFELFIGVGFLVLFGPGSSLQVTFGLLLALLYVNLYIYYAPLFTESLQNTKIATLWQLYFIFFLVLIIKAEFVDSEDVWIVICFILLIFASMVKNLWEFITGRRAAIANFRQNMGQRMRQFSRGSRTVEMDNIFVESRKSDQVD